MFLLFLATAFSGAAGLIDEVVWTRQLALVFGNTTHSIVAVLAAFFSGLSLGSALLGRLVHRIPSHRRALVYAFIEVGIALAAIAVTFSVRLLPTVYAGMSDGTAVTPSLLLVKFGLSALLLLMPTVLMGATLPLLVTVVRSAVADKATAFSRLYTWNTLGGTIGVLAAAFILIELVGLRGSVMVAALLNLVAGTLIIAARPKSAVGATPVPDSSVSVSYRAALLVVLAVTGAAALALEVLWTRLLTPSTGTFVYAFAIVLACFLLGIVLGSHLFTMYRRHSTNAISAFVAAELGVALFAALTAVVFLLGGPVSRIALSLVTMLPATICMGFALPAGIALFTRDQTIGRDVGVAYAWNTVGSIIGSLGASVLLIPLLGTIRSVVLLAGVSSLLVIVVEWTLGRRRWFSFSLVPASTLVVLASVVSVLPWQRFIQEPVNRLAQSVERHGANVRFAEDEVGSVLAYQNPTTKEEALFVDGVGMTTIGVETKLMAHLPIALHPDPEKMLVIALGMGTTFRSALLHDLSVDAVELVPSVPPLLTLFTDDGADVLANPRGRIIVNDGRNFAALTPERYDIITIDPPPPFNAAGTTVLYAREFYHELRGILETGGLVSQWLYFGSRRDDLLMATRSFVEAFPFVEAYRPIGRDKGVYLVGSEQPLVADAARLQAVFGSEVVRVDFGEVDAVITAADVAASAIASRDDLIARTEGFAPVTDDRPRTEYFLLRHALTHEEDVTLDDFLPLE